MDLARKPASQAVSGPILTLDDRQRLLLLLADGPARSCATLAASLDWSEEQVTEVLAHLTGAGLEIADTAHQTGRLTSGIEVLDPTRLVESLSAANRALLSELQLWFSVDSTNTRLKQYDTGTPGAHACFAEHQSAGRGRRGRRWVSPPATNLYLSLSSHYAPVPDLNGLSLALGLAAAHAIEDCGLPVPTIKWPNDLCWQDQKLGGILVELVRREPQSVDVIAGIGINTGIPPNAAASIDQPWTDLQQISGRPVPRNRLAGCLLDHWLTTLNQFAESGFPPWRSEFARRDALADRAVTLRQPDGKPIHGVARGIDQHGALRVETDAGISIQQAGEVSVRLVP